MAKRGRPSRAAQHVAKPDEKPSAKIVIVDDAAAQQSEKSSRPKPALVEISQENHAILAKRADELGMSNKALLNLICDTFFNDPRFKIEPARPAEIKFDAK